MAAAIRKSGRIRQWSHRTSNLTTRSIYLKVFVICEFNYDLQEIFRESLELVRKNVHQVCDIIL